MAPTILIVEDDRKIASLVAKNLEAAGFDCHQAHDGEKALQEFRRLSPSLVVLDIMIPLIDGLEVARCIRSEGDVPILMLTARSSEGDSAYTRPASSGPSPARFLRCSWLQQSFRCS